MNLGLRRAHIVLLASPHNPGAVSPSWLKDNEVIEEEPTQFVHTPDLVLFDSETFSLMLDSQRLQLTAKKHDLDSLQAAATVVAKYISLWPDLSYRAMGLNFVWVLQVAANENLPRIDVGIGSVDDFTEILAGHELEYGCIVHASKQPYRLRLMIDPETDRALAYSYNYHHEVSGLSPDTVAGYAAKFLEFYEKSRDLIRHTYEEETG